MITTRRLSCSLILVSSTALAQGGSRPDTMEEVIVRGQLLATIPQIATSTTKSPLALIDTPATITVINRELIDSQMAVNLQDV
ncbi:MAG: hypothetical protein AAF933_14095, partial [Pseudomonadota bacterium]